MQHRTFAELAAERTTADAVAAERVVLDEAVPYGKVEIRKPTRTYRRPAGQWAKGRGKALRRMAKAARRANRT